jgi:hypothetical protein
MPTSAPRERARSDATVEEEDPLVFVVADLTEAEAAAALCAAFETDATLPVVTAAALEALVAVDDGFAVEETERTMSPPVVVAAVGAARETETVPATYWA